jgi:hypothetical protein
MNACDSDGDAQEDQSDEAADDAARFTDVWLKLLHEAGSPDWKHGAGKGLARGIKSVQILEQQLRADAR